LLEQAAGDLGFAGKLGLRARLAAPNAPVTCDDLGSDGVTCNAPAKPEDKGKGKGKGK
jgi:hypothetical protein